MKLWKKRLTVALAGVMLLGGTVLAAVQGSVENPLVTLSYLKDVFTKSVTTELNQNIKDNQLTYEKKLDESVTAYTKEMEQLAGGGGSGGVFTVVDVPAGQALVGSVGCEVMLRVGTAICLSPDSPGLIDSTTGGILEGGAALTQNHLYVMTINGRSIKAEDAGVKLLVRGSYTLAQ